MNALIFEDELRMQMNLEHLVSSLQLKTESTSFSRSSDARTWIKNNSLDSIAVAILDVVEGEDDFVGVLIAKEIRAKNPSVPILFHTAHPKEHIPGIDSIKDASFIGKRPSLDKLIQEIEGQVDKLPIKPSQIRQGVIAVEYSGVARVLHLSNIVFARSLTKTFECKKVVDDVVEPAEETTWQRVASCISGGSNPMNSIGVVMEPVDDALGAFAIIDFEGNDTRQQVDDFLEKVRRYSISVNNQLYLDRYTDDIFQISKNQSNKNNFSEYVEDVIPVLRITADRRVFLLRNSDFRFLKIVACLEGEYVEILKPNVTLNKFIDRVIQPYLGLYPKSIPFKKLPAAVVNLNYVSKVNLNSRKVSFGNLVGGVIEDFSLPACQSLLNFSDLIKL